jgi:hypothetical protein
VTVTLPYQCALVVAVLLLAYQQLRLFGARETIDRQAAELQSATSYADDLKARLDACNRALDDISRLSGRWAA